MGVGALAPWETGAEHGVRKALGLATEARPQWLPRYSLVEAGRLLIVPFVKAVDDVARYADS